MEEEARRSGGRLAYLASSRRQRRPRQLLALVKKIGPKTLWPEEGLPPKLDKQHKQRSHAAACTAAMRAPLVDVPMPPIVAFATPIPFPAIYAPLVAASPLPMMPFGSVAL